jgi:hypothetical protein
MWGASSSTYSAHDKIRQKETLIESTIENRLNDLGKRLGASMPIPLEPALTLYLQDILKDQRFLNKHSWDSNIPLSLLVQRAASYRPLFSINHRKMDAIEFNKTLSEAHSISSKLEHQKKMLTECRNMGFEKHTTVITTVV